MTDSELMLHDAKFWWPGEGGVSSMGYPYIKADAIKDEYEPCWNVLDDFDEDIDAQDAIVSWFALLLSAVVASEEAVVTE